MQLFQLKYIITEPKPRSNSSQINPGPPRFLWALSEMHQQITSTAANVSPSGWFVISAVSVTKFSQVGPPQSEPHQPTNMMISEKETVLQILDWAGLISWAELQKARHGHGGYGGMRVPRPEISDDGPGSLYVAASGPAWTSHYH